GARRSAPRPGTRAARREASRSRRLPEVEERYVRPGPSSAPRRGERLGAERVLRLLERSTASRASFEVETAGALARVRLDADLAVGLGDHVALVVLGDREQAEHRVDLPRLHPGGRRTRRLGLRAGGPLTRPR